MLYPEIWPAEVVDGPVVMLITWAEADHDSGIEGLIREDVADPCGPVGFDSVCENVIQGLRGQRQKD